MKKWYMLCMYGVFGIVCADAQKEHFLQGKDYVKQGRIQEALEQFREIENPGFATWYYKGHCYEKNEQYEKALIAYKQAEKQVTWDQFFSLRERIVECQLKCGAMLDSYVQTYARFIATMVSLWFAQWFFLFISLLCILLLCVKKIQSIFVRVSIVTIWIVVAVFLACTWYYVAVDEGIVREKAKVYSGPQENFHEMRVLLAGEAVHIKKVQENWYKIHDKDGVGWVRSDNIERLTV